MYDNISVRIKGAAKIIFILGLILSVIFGIYIIKISDNALKGLILIGIGILSFWVISLLVYGFAEIIDKVIEIENNTRNERYNFKTRLAENSFNESQIENIREKSLKKEDEYRKTIK